MMIRAAWLQLAVTEFRRAFAPPWRRAPGGRDLLSVSLMNALLIALLAVGCSVNEGLVANFADGIVGRHGDAGVPIRVAVNPALAGRASELAAQFQPRSAAAGADGLARYALEPFVEIEPGARFFRLPGNPWTANEAAAQPSFTGWAFDTRSSLWRSLAGQAADPADQQVLVLNRTLFARHFDLDAYVKALAGLLPPPVLARWKQDAQRPGDMGWLFADVPGAAGGRQLAMFRIVWAESFPVQQPLAFIMPAATFRALELAADNPALGFPAQVEGAVPERAVYVRLFDIDRLGSGGGARVAGFQACLPGARKGRSPTTDLFLEFPQPMPVPWVQACLEQHGFTDPRQASIDSKIFPTMVLRPDGVTVACDALLRSGPARSLLTEAQQRGCVGTHLMAPFGSFRNGLVYAPSRQEIRATTEAIRAAVMGGQNALYISDLYQNSIDRFSYLIGTMSFVVLPAAIFLVVVVTYALAFQIATLLGHRRAYYGVLLARGLAWHEVHAIVATQLLLGVAIAAVAAVGAFELGKLALNSAFLHSPAAALATSTLGIEQPRLVVALDAVRDWTDLGGLAGSSKYVWLATGFIAALNLICAAVLLWLLPLRPNTTPLKLIAQR